MAKRNEPNIRIGTLLNNWGCNELTTKNYIVASSVENWWSWIGKKMLSGCIATNGNNDFYIGIVRHDNVTIDSFYAIPYSHVKHLLIPELEKTKKDGAVGWNILIENGIFRTVRPKDNPNAKSVETNTISVVKFLYPQGDELKQYPPGDRLEKLKDVFSKQPQETTSAPSPSPSVSPSSDPEAQERAIEEEITSKRAEIEQRLQQSKFRKGVLEKFNGQCCLSGIYEQELLVASHIVPWAADEKSRLDPNNGLCLFVSYDKLFDKGYFTVDDEGRVVIPDDVSRLSRGVQELLYGINRRKIAFSNGEIPRDYLAYHRTEIYVMSPKKKENR